MKYKRLLPLILLLFISSSVASQKMHELKFDIFNAFGSNYIPRYEILLSEKIGIELELGFDFSKIYLTNFDISNFEQFKFGARQFNPGLSGKYYFWLNKKHGSGFFVGPYFQANFLMYREEGYVTKYEEVYNTTASERIRTDKGIKLINYGINFGYKWIIKSHYIIEIMSVATGDTQVGKGAMNLGGAPNSDTYFKIGYRF